MVAFTWNGSQFDRLPYLKVPDTARQEENVFRCIPIDKTKKIGIIAKDAAWCKSDGNLGKKLDLAAYSRAADLWAEIPRWSPANRSD